MIMPAYTTLPESMLSPSQITDKFNVPTMGGLRGLGACGDCLEYDDSGNCVSIDSTGCDTSSSGGTLNASDCAYGGTYPNCNPAPTSTGTTTTSPTGTSSSGTSSSTLTAAQQAALDNTILKGGLSLAQQLALQPGQSLVGTNVVSGAVSGTALGLSSGITSLMPLIILGVGAFLLFGRGK